MFEMIVSSLVGYATTKGLDWALKDNSKAQKGLTKHIRETTDEFKSKYPIAEEGTKYPFYNSHVFVTELLKARFFINRGYSFNISEIQESTNELTNVIKPTNEQVVEFLNVLENKLKEDEDIEEFVISENYKREIFNITNLHLLLHDKLDNIENKLDDLSRQANKNLEEGQLNNVPSRDESEIIGRGNKLNEVKQKLNAGEPVLLLNGMGGVGKTTIAEVFVAKYFADYKHTAWITVKDSFEDALISDSLLIKNLGITNTETKNLLGECLVKLNNLPGPNLLIIDNADINLKKIKRFLPKAPNWHILITSRNRMKEFNIIDVDFLTEDEAIELFTKFCKRFDNNQIKNIVNLVELHTLTVEVFAKAAEENNWSYETLCNALKENRETNIDDVQHADTEPLGKIKTYLVRIFNASNLTQNQKYILKQFAALPQEYFSIEVLQALLQVEQLDWKENFVHEVKTLYRTGFLMFNEEINAYKLHAVLNEVVLAELKPTVEDCTFLINSVTNLVSYDHHKDDYTKKFPYIPLGEAVLKVFNNSEHEKIAILQNYLGILLKQAGFYEKAREYLEKALELGAKNFGENHPTVSILYSNFGLVYKDLGDYEKAREYLEKALESGIKNFGETHPTVATYYSNLGLVYRDLGDYEKAREYLEKALELGAKNFGENHPTVSILYSNLGLVYKDLGDYEKAREYLEKALESDIKNFGEDHPSVATRYSNLGSVYQALGDYEKARDYLEKALESGIKNFGEDHPSVAIDYSNLGMVYKDLGEYEKARDYLEKALESDIKNFGENHPSVATDLNNLGYVYWNMEMFKEAIESWEQAFVILKDTLGLAHPYTKSVQNTLEQAYKLTGKG